MYSQAREGIIQSASRKFSSERGAPVSSPSTTLPEGRKLQLIAAGAIVGLAFFSATALLLPLISEYSLTGDYISELASGQYGYLQTAAFFAVGGSSLALAVGIREATKGSWGSRMGSAFFGLYGLGGVGLGLRVRHSGYVRTLEDLQAKRSLASVLALVFGAGSDRAGRVLPAERATMGGVESADLRRDDHFVAGAGGLPAPLHRQSRVGRATSAGALGVRTSENANRRRPPRLSDDVVSALPLLEEPLPLLKQGSRRHPQGLGQEHRAPLYKHNARKKLACYRRVKSWYRTSWPREAIHPT